MRLQEVYSIRQQACESWPDLSFDEKKATGGVVYFTLKNLYEVQMLLQLLSPLPFLTESINDVKKTSPGFNQLNGIATFDGSSKNNLLGAYNRLKSKAITIVDFFNSIKYTQQADGFDIKLPPDISLLDLSRCAKDLNTVFSTCPLLSKEGCSVSLAAVDVGSIWLSFVIGGATVASVLGIIAALVDKALIIRSHHLTTQEQAERIKSLQMGNDALEQANRINQEIGKQLLNQVCKDLSEEHNVEDPEDFERLKNSVKLLSDWMCKGMEIYAAVQAPTEVKAVFPPVETQALAEKAIALLAPQTSDAEE